MSDIIRVGRNASGNCVVFYGQTNPVYFNACLSAEIIDTDYISIKNDIATGLAAGTPTYEYYRIHFSKWQRDDLSVFTSAQEVADYINEIGNVTDVPTGGYSFQGAESLDFTHDETKTSILFSNGDHHGINSVKAVGKDNGKIGIQSIRGDFEFYELEFASCTIGGVSAGNTLQTVANNLNAFFTLSAQTAPIPAPVYTQQDGVDIAWIERETVDPVGTGLYGSGTSGTFYHGPRVYTSETINEPGEYFTFEAKNVVAGGGPLLGLGLYSVANGDLTEIEDDTLSNSGHHGYFFSTWLYNYAGYTAPWTTYGSHSGLSYGPGWSFYGNTPMFRYSDANTVFRQGEGPVDGTALFKVGITDSGFVGVWYYDYEQPGVDEGYGLRSGDWILLARSTTPVPAGEYGLLVKIPSTSGQIMTQPKRFATDPAAPTLYYRYIESPDGEFHYPLFSSEEEANYVDTQNGGGGTSHTHTYADEITNTTWYMPDTGGTMSGVSAPTGSEYTEIPTADDNNYIPPAFTGLDLSVQEGTSVNIQVTPAGASWTTTVSGLPAGLIYDGYSLVQGTAPQVSSDTTSTITVTRANSFGSSVGTFDLTVTDSAPPQTNDTSWTKALDFSGSSERAQMVSISHYYNPMMMDYQSVTTSAPGTPGNTSSHTQARPWATAVVFSPDGHNSNQHIWNIGEGAGSTDDNIYLRIDSSRNLYFGWGRDGALNEYYLARVSAGSWNGVYVGFNGTRLSGTNATATNLAAAFDIRLMFNTGSGWNFNPNPTAQGWGTWSSTGGRMDRSVTGSMNIGGRGTNRNFHGKVASFVTTTLERDHAMPNSTEIEVMITDPVGWLNDYKVGNDYRASHDGASLQNFLLNNQTAASATQVYLMGDGTSDSYSNMIRNQVRPADQSYTKLNLLSMQSNDIQNVTISGLS